MNCLPKRFRESAHDEALDVDVSATLHPHYQSIRAECVGHAHRGEGAEVLARGSDDVDRAVVVVGVAVSLG